MTIRAFQSLAALTPRSLRVGGMRVPIYEIFAVLGLILALWLSRRAARLVSLSGDRLWDAGIFAVAAALVSSRLLLVVQDPHAFLRYPLLVLSLRSFTYGGMLLTALLTWAYLRWNRLPVLNVLDAWAPCAALLAAALELGDFAAGADEGMPVNLPWGNGHGALRAEPVGLLGAGLALGICVMLLWHLRLRKRGGQTGALAMMAGGCGSFLLDMLRQPVASTGKEWLEPSQWIALAAMLAGAGIWTALGKGARSERAQLPQGYRSGTIGSEAFRAPVKEVH